MARHVCSICGYVHDDSKEDVAFDQLPDSWTCPICGAARNQFEVEKAAEAGEDAGAADVVEAVKGTAPETTEVVETALPAAPKRGALLVHRVFGYVFLAVYALLMIQMVPRLWTYQIEFPARTVVHLSLGMAAGVMLLLKISVVRFFRRMDPMFVPMLGTAILVSSVVLIGISVPSAFREAFATARLFTEENRARVRGLLAQAGFDEAQSVRLTTTESLRAGQRILRHECIDCHDLRTVLTKPRTPSNWRQTVSRMADRTTLLDPLDEDDQLKVTAYLTALSPQLQKSARQLRAAADRRDETKRAAAAIAAPTRARPDFDPVQAKALFEKKCSQCHETSLVAQTPPGSESDARRLVAAMVDEGLEATESELALIVRYLTTTYVK